MALDAVAISLERAALILKLAFHGGAGTVTISMADLNKPSAAGKHSVASIAAAICTRQLSNATGASAAIAAAAGGAHGEAATPERMDYASMNR